MCCATHDMRNSAWAVTGIQTCPLSADVKPLAPACHPPELRSWRFCWYVLSDSSRVSESRPASTPACIAAPKATHVCGSAASSTFSPARASNHRRYHLQGHISGTNPTTCSQTSTCSVRPLALASSSWSCMQGRSPVKAAKPCATHGMRDEPPTSTTRSTRLGFGA